MLYDDYYDSDNWNDEDKFFEWQLKAKKASTKGELLPIAWRTSRYWDWFIPEEEKKEIQKNCGEKYRPFLCLVTRYKNFLIIEK